MRVNQNSATVIELLVAFSFDRLVWRVKTLFFVWSARARVDLFDKMSQFGSTRSYRLWYIALIYCWCSYLIGDERECLLLVSWPCNGETLDDLVTRQKKIRVPYVSNSGKENAWGKMHFNAPRKQTIDENRRWLSWSEGKWEGKKINANAVWKKNFNPLRIKKQVNSGTEV